MEDFKKEKLARLQQKVREGSKDPEHHRDLADLLSDRGEWREACSLLESALRLSLTDAQRAELSVQYGLLLYEYLGEDDKARELAQTAIALLPADVNDPETVLSRGLAEFLLAHYLFEPEEALNAARRSLADLESVLRSNPDVKAEKTALHASGTLYLFLDDSESAIKSCEACMRLALDDEERLRCIITLGKALHASGDSSQAIQVLRDAAHALGENADPVPQLHYELGIVELSQREFRNARDNFLRAIAACQENGTVFRQSVIANNIHLAEAYYELDQFQEAIGACQEIVAFADTENSFHWGAVGWLGYCYLAQGSLPQARFHFEEILNSNSSEVSSEIRDWAVDGLKEVLDTAALFSYASGDFANAASEYERLLSLQAEEESRCRVHLALGHCRAALGDSEQAVTHYRAVLASLGATPDQKVEAAEAVGMGGSIPPSFDQIQ